MVREKIHPAWEEQSDISSGKDLILFNDDVNTFDWVIETLIEVCGHDAIQAEQCAMIAHFNGKCPVKTGTYEELKPVSDEMTKRELTVSIA
jgi:ATP-dependent Clp protease adaptor protein ClpS